LTRETRRVETETVGKTIWQGLSNISEEFNGGEVLAIYRSGVLIYFPCPFGFNSACHLRRKGKSPDASAIVKVRQHSPVYLDRLPALHRLASKNPVN